MKTLKEYIERLEEIEADEAPVLSENTREVAETLREVEMHIAQAVEAAEYLAKIARGTVEGPFTGQLQSYLIPHLNSWINDEQQPGSIPSLRRMLDEPNEDEPDF